VTEIIFALGAGETIKGLTTHITLPSAVNEKEIIGSYMVPCIEKIQALDPDVVFTSSHHTQIRNSLAGFDCQVITLKTESLEDSYQEIRLLGQVFDRKERAQTMVADMKSQLDLIQKKISKIPNKKRKRVIRLMGRNEIMTPGQDSFQNEFITLAGGIPPKLGKKGDIVPVSKKEWQEFDPQVIYGCGNDHKVAEKFFSRTGWKDVQAVQDGSIYWFPCALTCRAATHSGYFVSWLASKIYSEEFEQEKNLVLEQKIEGNQELDLELQYVQQAVIAKTRIHDFENKTLIIDFTKPMQIVSTLEGQRSDITKVGNHYSSPPCWSLGHQKGLGWVRDCVYKVIETDYKQASFLFTGADMDNLSIQRQDYKDMAVYALVTAGVTSNAMRMSKDEGSFYEPGTINIILLPNMKLSSRAMTRAIISATEAKSAALLDMDIRSSYSPLEHKATGTGTDNILVAEGTGPDLKNAGGHTKLGELIARAVYAGVKEAIGKQNGLITKRSVFRRLQERNIGLYELIAQIAPDNSARQKMLNTAYSTLLESKYANFIKTAFSISDDYEKGLLTNLSALRLCCQEISADIAGQSIKDMKNFVYTDNLPLVQKMALNAFLNGIWFKSKR
jgi:ABC-type Fe3+-hydroxamate transport system substrate-binding protein/adenosylcobinamide amidohydrolase